MTDFARAVGRVLRSLPAGHVVTYGEVAAEAGRPGAARAVGAVLRGGSCGDVPWWRVVDARGRVFPGGVAEATRLLSDEGVAVRDGRVVGSRQPAVRSRRLS